MIQTSRWDQTLTDQLSSTAPKNYYIIEAKSYLFQRDKLVN